MEAGSLVVAFDIEGRSAAGLTRLELAANGRLKAPGLEPLQTDVPEVSPSVELIAQEILRRHELSSRLLVSPLETPIVVPYRSPI